MEVMMRLCYLVIGVTVALSTHQIHQELADSRLSQAKR